MRNRTAEFILWMCLLTVSWTPSDLHAERHTSSGIEGQAVVSPNVSLDGTILGGTPVQAHVKVWTSRGRFVTSFVTEADGTFKVSLSPGDYLLIPDSPSNPYWVPVQTAVHVARRAFTTVTIGYYIPPM